MKGVVLCYKGEQVFVELARHYLIYLCEKKTLEELTPSQIVLLANQTVVEHERRTIH